MRPQPSRHQRVPDHPSPGNGSVAHATSTHPSGCLKDLFSWVGVTVGAGSNGKPQPNPFTDETTNEGSNSMGFYNVSTGDMPYFKSLANQ